MTNCQFYKKTFPINSLAWIIVIASILGCKKEETHDLLFQDFAGKFLFTTNNNSTTQINTLIKGSSRQLTKSSQDKTSPQWSFDGKHIYYLSNEAEQFNIRIMSDDGLYDKALIDVGTTRHLSSHYPSMHISPDGQYIAVHRPDSIFLYAVTDTSSLLKIAAYSCFTQFKYLAWAPNSKLFSCGCPGQDNFRNLFVFNVETLESKNITSGLDRHVVRQTWSHNSSQIAFSSLDIYLINADGSGLKNLIETSNYAESQLSFSPFDNQLVYQRADSLFDLVMYDIETQQSEILLNDLGYIHGPFIWVEGGKYIFHGYGEEAWETDTYQLFDFTTKVSYTIFNESGREFNYTDSD